MARLKGNKCHSQMDISGRMLVLPVIGLTHLMEDSQGPPPPPPPKTQQQSYLSENSNWQHLSILTLTVGLSATSSEKRFQHVLNLC